MIENIDLVLIEIKETFKKISDEQLQEMYPSELLSSLMTILYFLLPLQAHLNYHLGPEVVLHPTVTITSETMLAKANALHHKANEFCYIAKSCNFLILHQQVFIVKEILDR